MGSEGQTRRKSEDIEDIWDDRARGTEVRNLRISSVLYDVIGNLCVATYNVWPGIDVYLREMNEREVT